MANFKLPMWCHYMWYWAEMCSTHYTVVFSPCRYLITSRMVIKCGKVIRKGLTLFITFVFNIIYIIENFCNFIFNNGCVQQLACLKFSQNSSNFDSFHEPVYLGWIILFFLGEVYLFAPVTFALFLLLCSYLACPYRLTTLPSWTLTPNSLETWHYCLSEVSSKDLPLEKVSQNPFPLFSHFGMKPSDVSTSGKSQIALVFSICLMDIVLSTFSDLG